MFVSVDVETANADVGSICQIGIAKFDESGLTGVWKSLVDPEDYFDGMNVAIHGINETDVVGAPTFGEVSEKLVEHLGGVVVVSHTPFDRSAINKASTKYALQEIECTWLDSARVVRRVWEQFSQRGYGLSNVAKFLGYEYQAHDALEDAKAAGYVVLAALQESGLEINELIGRVYARNTRYPESISKEGDPDGPLYGEELVFTGALQMSRRDAAEIAAKLGCTVAPRVTQRTTLLVVGDQDLSLLAGHEKSSKHRKAEELIKKGLPIRILQESDFQQLLVLAS